MYNISREQGNYSKILSSLFCSISIITLSFLSLLNSLSLDLYSMVVLLKVVVPASFCFWFIGLTIGKIFDSMKNKKAKMQELTSDNKAYEIPSMFNSTDEISETEEINDENLEVL